MLLKKFGYLLKNQLNDEYANLIKKENNRLTQKTVYLHHLSSGGLLFVSQVGWLCCRHGCPGL